jgi:hypothetical protein
VSAVRFLDDRSQFIYVTVNDFYIDNSIRMSENSLGFKFNPDAAPVNGIRWDSSGPGNANV